MKHHGSRCGPATWHRAQLTVMGAAQEASTEVVSKEEQGGGGSRDGKQTQRPEDDLRPMFKRGVLGLP